ncbi:unnamed protein product, partial [Rotaria magnacalcarata]
GRKHDHINNVHLAEMDEISMSMDGGDMHFFLLNGFNDFENLSGESEDRDSIGVMLNVDEEENNIADMTKTF